MQTILILAVLVTVVNCESYSPLKLKSLPPPVQYFYPYQNGCHQFYGGEETVSQYSCRSLDFSKMGCFNLSDAKRFTYQIRTPSDEIIEFIQDPFMEKLLPEGCYKVIGKEDKKSMVCQKSFGDNVTGITTPDNYTMLFTSPSCDAATLTWDMDKIKKFVADYKFDVDARSCYKVYDEGELPSPYTCLRDYIPESCVYRYNSSCLAITTSKNDTVLLSCQNEIDTQEDPEHKCFNVIAADGEVHEVCQKTFGEWCIGLEMPSGLTVLFECSFCQFGVTNGFGFRNEYSEEDLRNQRAFVKKWLADDYSGTKKRFDQTELIVFKPNETVVVYPFCNDYEINRLYPYWLPNTNCWGVDVNENERIMLECTSSKRTPGCFDIESNGDKQEVCLKIIHEKCVGVKTPLNYTLILDCNEGQNCFRETIYKDPFDVLSPEEYDKFPVLEECFEIYDEEPTDYTCYKPTDLNNYACTTEIQHEGKTCYGFKTPKKETIMYLQCQDDQTEPVGTLFQIGAAPKKTRNCFKVIQEDGAVEMVCPKRFGEVSIGITTSKNSSVLFKSPCQHYTSKYDLNDYKKFYKNYKFDLSVRSCYKVYEESENVSPFNCMSKEIKHACIHKLEYFEGCEGIVTQNNETILLDCKGRESLESGCFEVFTADGTRHIACLKQLEARCAGIITPSNLTVLFECSFCSSHPVGYLTPPDFRKTNRYFISRALTLFKTGNYSFNTKMDFRVCDDTSINSLAECYFMMKTYKVRPLPDFKNCLGTTLPNLETIIFECPDKSFVKNGCFDVFRPKFDSDGNFIVTEKVGNVCTQYLDEECVGLKTPGEWNVLLACITTNVFAQQENGTIWYQNLTDAS